MPSETLELDVTARLGAFDLKAALTLPMDGITAVFGPSGNDELQRAKDFAAGTFRLSMETPMALGQHFGTQLLQDGEIELPGETVERVRAVEASEVQAVAQRLFPSAPADRLAAILAA